MIPAIVLHAHAPSALMPGNDLVWPQPGQSPRRRTRRWAQVAESGPSGQAGRRVRRPHPSAHAASAIQAWPLVIRARRGRRPDGFSFAMDIFLAGPVVAVVSINSVGVQSKMSHSAARVWSESRSGGR